MIWHLKHVDSTLIEAFEPAGEPDQAVIDRHVASHGQHPPKHAGIKRWYYLHKENPRIRLATVGMPLEEWHGEAKIIVGTGVIIGEFPGNQAFVGKMGLRLQMEPIAWLEGKAEQQFAIGAQLLAELSEQVLDKRAIDRSQQAIKRRYEHHRR